MMAFILLVLAGYIALCGALGFAICRMMDGAD